MKILLYLMLLPIVFARRECIGPKNQKDWILMMCRDTPELETTNMSYKLLNLSNISTNASYVEKKELYTNKTGSISDSVNISTNVSYTEKKELYTNNTGSISYPVNISQNISYPDINISETPSPRIDIVAPSSKEILEIVSTKDIVSPSSSLRGLTVESPSMISSTSSPSSNVITDDSEIILVLSIIVSSVLIITGLAVLALVFARKRKNGGIHPCPPNNETKKKKRNSYNRPVHKYP